jgi:hypothetical protein
MPLKQGIDRVSDFGADKRGKAALIPAAVEGTCGAT